MSFDFGKRNVFLICQNIRRDVPPSIDVIEVLVDCPTVRISICFKIRSNPNGRAMYGPECIAFTKTSIRSIEEKV